MLKFGSYMSKIGKQPIKLPEGVTVEITGNTIVVKGPKGSLTRLVPREMEVIQKGGVLQVVPKRKSRSLYALFGTTRALINNMVIGVTQGWKKVLELIGAGYKAETTGKTLTLNVGFSHPVKIEAPEGVIFEVEKTLITIEGQDKEMVGQMAAKVRAIRPPEPYKGKGIKYQDEIIRRKPGKAAKTVGAAV